MHVKQKATGLHDSTYLQRQVGVLLLLAHLQTWQMGIFQLQVVFLPEVLGHSALHRLTVLKLQWKSVDLKVTRMSFLFIIVNGRQL